MIWFLKTSFNISSTDSIISFESLSHKIVHKIVNKFIKQLENTLLKRNVSINVNNNVMNFLVTKGFSDIYGARPISRLIQSKIKEPIADYLLSNSKFKSKILIKVSMLENNKLKFNFITRKMKEKLLS